MTTATAAKAFDLNDYTEYLDLNRFQYCFVSYSGGVLAIATDTSLILTDETNNNGFKFNDHEETRLVLEFNEDSGRATCIQWIIEGAVVSVGFESGLLVCFNCKGEEIFEFKGNNSSVQSIKVASTDIHKNDASIWVLYEGGYIVSFPVSHLENHNANIASYRLSSHKLVNDFVFLPSVYKSSIFDLDEYDQQNNMFGTSGAASSVTTAPNVDKNVMSSPNTSKKSHKRSNSHNVAITKDLLSIFTAGKECTLAVYNLGAIASNESDKNVSVRESTVNILSKGVMSLYNSLYGSTDTTTTVYKPDHQRVQESLLTVAAKVEFQDTKRRVVKLSADPTGAFIACSDVLGRVMLFDTQVCAVVRIWKGLRNAELVWTTRIEESSAELASVHDPNSSTSNAVTTASLVIHAPLLGLVYIYRVPHGECIRIVPVGLNCHILSLSVPPFSSSDDNSGVRAYLLKPHADSGTLELSEIRPSDRTDADLDVRLTLVGDDVYTPGGEKDEENDGDNVVPYEDDNSTMDLSSSSTDNAVHYTTNPTRAVPILHLPTNHYTSTSPSHSFREGNTTATATDMHAMRNIEQSLQLLVDCIPMAALYSHVHASSSHSTNINGINCYPLSKDAFVIEVQRAEESILETLSAHRSVLSLSSLYKCVCLIENVELYGTLQPPNYAINSSATSINKATDCVGDMHTLLSSLATINTANATTITTNIDVTTSITNNTFLSEQSAASLQSFASNDSVPNLTIDTDTLNLKKALLTKLAAGLLLFPVFSAQLHRTLLTMLDSALKHHANKFQYDIHTGAITHLPAPILEYVTAELPLRQQLLQSYTTLREISDATILHSGDVAFTTIPSLNVRGMFDRAAPTTACIAMNSLNNTLLAMNASGAQSATNRASSPLNTTAATINAPSVFSTSAITISAAGKSATDEIAALVKSGTGRSEAALWALRAAQNDELRAVGKVSAAPVLVTESNSGKHDRIASVDSASSYRSLPSNLYDPTITTTTNTPATATPNVSISADHPSVDLTGIAVTTNAHSKVKRMGHSNTPPRSPLDGLNTTDSNQSVPALRRNFSNGNFFRKGSRGSLTMTDALATTADYEYSLSFSTFRAFVSLHGPHHTVATTTTTFKTAVTDEMYQFYSPLPTLRMSSLLSCIAESEHFYFGNMRGLLDTISSVYDNATIGATDGSGVGNGMARSPDNHSPIVSTHNAAMIAEESDTTSATAVTLLRALTLKGMSVEAFKPSTSGSAAKSVAKEGTMYSPNVTIPHTLLHTLVTPLLGDVFSLSNYTTALSALGIKGIVTPIMHISPLFIAHIAHQNSSFLLTDVLCKKLTIFPYQRWLRDSLLSFQDALGVHMNNVFSAHANRNTSVDTNGGSFRVNVTSSAEKDARDIMYLNRLHQNNSGDNLYSSSFHQGGNDLNCEEDVKESATSTDEISTLAEEIRRVNRRTIEVTSTEADIASGVNVLRINTMEQGTPSYNDFIRHILRPAYLYCLTCPNLEAVMVFASIVLETLQIVNEQVERRTYGAMSLNQVNSNNANIGTMGNTSGYLESSTGVIPIWEGLIRQIRVALLLQSRKGTESGVSDRGGKCSPSADSSKSATTAVQPFTLSALSTGLISTHRLLASDTLAFALRAEQALEHEDKCREVYNRSVLSAGIAGGAGGSGSAPTISTSISAKAEVLLAYGPTADRRWKDLLALSVAEDAMTAANIDDNKTVSKDASATMSEEQKRSVRKRRPLLLYFPAHSQPHYLGAYRSILLTERWFVSLHRVDLLVSAVQHLFSLPVHSYRPAIAAYLYSLCVFPVVQVLTLLEEERSLFEWVSGGHSVSSYSGNRELAVKMLSDEQVQNLLKLMGDNRLLKAFVNAGAELLGYVETAVQAPTSKSAVGNTITNTSSIATTTTNNKHHLWQHPHVQHALCLHSAAEHRSVYHNENPNNSINNSNPINTNNTSLMCWPSSEDMFVNTLLLRFVEQCAGPYDTAPVVAKPLASSSPLWSLTLLSEHISRLWTLHIRSLCGLKSIKPSQIMGEGVIHTMQAFGDKYNSDCWQYSESSEVKVSIKAGSVRNTSLSSHFTVSDAERMAFLTQCLKKMVHTRQPTGVVYVLVLRWLSMQSYHNSNHKSSAQNSTMLSMDAVRLQHLHILLAEGGGSRDEEAEQMVHQITQTELVLDTLIEALRSRLGGILSAIDQLPSFGPLIAAMDAEAVVWARSSVQRTQTVVTAAVGVSGGNSGGAEITGSAGAADAGSEFAAICKNLNVNIASTRHLIVCVQSTLMNVPINMRTSGEIGSSGGIHDVNRAGAAAAVGGKTTWFERKTKCDALLTLCKYFAQQLSQVKG